MAWLTRSWGNLCPLRFSSAVSHFYLLPLASSSYTAYSSRLTSIAKQHHATLFIPVSGAGSSVEDARAADAMFAATSGVCKTFIQDPETMLDLHDKDRFQKLVGRLGMPVPEGKMVTSVQEAIEFLEKQGKEPRFVLKCMGLDENRGDMTLWPLKGDGEGLGRTKRALEGLRLKIEEKCPYVFQEFIPGQGKFPLPMSRIAWRCGGEREKDQREEDYEGSGIALLGPLAVKGRGC